MAKILDMADEQQMVLRTEDLVKKYKTRTVVNHVSINVKQGEIVGLLGPNGAGKTTTFYMTVGLVTPNEGKIFLNDMEITKFPVYKRARNGIGYLAQEASIFRKMTVEDNIRSVLEMTETTPEYQKEKLESLIAEFGLNKVRKNLGDQLSGGERRKIAEDGELCMHGDSIMLGYYKDPEATAEVIDADGWFHTGDLARKDEDGYYFLTGRKKNLIILDSGENINPEELEGIVGKCEAVKECVVKEMGKKIGVVVYCDEDKQQQVRDFITEANRTLPLYKRMSAVEFSTEPLPRNGAGKLLRQ